MALGPSGVNKGLSDILAQKLKTVTTYKALVVLGLQDDVIGTTDNKESSSDADFVDPILKLIPKWRDRAGYVIWIKLPAKSRIELPRTQDDVASFFGKLGNPKPGAVQPDNLSDFTPRAKALINERADIILNAPYASLSSSSTFLMALRKEMITEIFICGCLVDSTGYSIMYDAARQGVETKMIDDCVGYKEKYIHNMLSTYVKEEMNVEGITSSYISEDLDAPREQSTTAEDLQATLDALNVKPSPRGSPSPRMSPSPTQMGRKLPSKTKIKTRNQQRQKDSGQAMERQRVKQALLGDPYAAVAPSDRPVSERSGTHAAISSSPQSSLSESTTIQAPHAMNTRHVSSPDKKSTFVAPTIIAEILAKSNQLSNPPGISKK